MIRSVILVFGLMVVVPAYAQTAVPQSSSADNSCRYWTGSPQAGGIEVIATNERTTSASSISGQTSAISLTIWSPKPLRTAPRSSETTNLFLVIPGTFVESWQKKEPNKYLDGQVLQSRDSHLRTARILNVTAHYSELSSNRYDIDPADWSDLRISESLITYVGGPGIKLFELNSDSGFYPPKPIGIASIDFNVCMNAKTSVAFTKPPGPLVIKATVKPNSSELGIADIMPDFRSRLTPGKSPFPSTVDLEIQVTAEGRALQCQLRPNSKLEQFSDVKGKICQQAIRKLRFAPATDVDQRPVPDSVIVSLRIIVPCDPKIEKGCV